VRRNRVRVGGSVDPREKQTPAVRGSQPDASMQSVEDMCARRMRQPFLRALERAAIEHARRDKPLDDQARS